MSAIAKQTWSDFVTVTAVWAGLVFVLMFYHKKVGMPSEWMPQVVFGSFVLVAILAPIGSLLWRRVIRST
ncbi:hypothetical protein Mmar10_0708 [Maricaulis maris MCS10]|uniref:Uncharacterized protein n=1 Tax=Maricaulis maris (strain MCS10) TaxID=394221 RepID=Q0ART6_MARMM|nr:hypothetical protein [Maricaulis maris]ABI65001.1 hypothetical protein Mmar10_0708 [Maricaulis maris MCS10]